MNRYVNKSKIKGLFVTVLIICLMIATITQYQAKAKYKSYISSDIMQSLQSLNTILHENNNIYEAILGTGALSSDQAYLLVYNNETISRIILENATRAVKLDYKEEDFAYSLSSLNAQKIALSAKPTLCLQPKTDGYQWFR